MAVFLVVVLSSHQTRGTQYQVSKKMSGINQPLLNGLSSEILGVSYFQLIPGSSTNVKYRLQSWL